GGTFGVPATGMQLVYPGLVLQGQDQPLSVGHVKRPHSLHGQFGHRSISRLGTRVPPPSLAPARGMSSGGRGTPSAFLLLATGDCPRRAAPGIAPGDGSVADAHPLYDPDDPEAVACYAGGMRALHAAGAPFLVGGAYAFARYTGIVRHTKDCDLFLRETDLPRAIAALAAVGYRTEIAYSHWLAKAYRGHHFIDLIFNSGNGRGAVDDAWFDHSIDEVVFGE